MQPNPQNFFQLLYERGVGTQCAVFYIGWANYFISLNNFKQADIIFKKGFNIRAQPIEELQAAYTKFHYTETNRPVYDDALSKKRPAAALEQRQTEYAIQQQNLPSTVQMPQQNKKIKLENNYVEIYNGHNSNNEYESRILTNHSYQPNYCQNDATITANVAPQYNGTAPSEYNNQQAHNNNNNNNHHYEQHQQLPNQQQHQVAAAPSNQYCNLDNSAYYISSSLNYVYNNEETVNNYDISQTDQIHQQVVSQPTNYTTNYNLYGDINNMNGEQSTNLNINLPHNFAAESKNDPNDTWKVPLMLEEPYEPNRKCCYPKHLVYPGNDIEYSLDEIRSRKYKKKIDEVKEKLRLKQFYDAEVVKKRQQQQLYEQQQYYLQQQDQIKKQNEENARYNNNQQQQQQQQQYLQYNYQQQPTQSEQPPSQNNLIANNEANGNNNYNYTYSNGGNLQNEQQITNVYEANQEQEHHHLRIKIKKPKDGNHYNSNLIKTMNDSDDEDNDEAVDDNDNTLTDTNQDYDDQIVATAINYDNKIIRIKYKKAPQSADATAFVSNGQNTSTNGRAKKVPSKTNLKNKTKKSKLKNISTVNDYDNSCNSSDVNNQMDDANLLLSIANLKSSRTLASATASSSTATSTATTPKSDPQYLNHDDSSYSNSEFNSSFSNISFVGNVGPSGSVGDNSNSGFYQCATPIKNNNQYLKTSTPHTRFTKKYVNNNSLTDFTLAQNDDSMSSMTSEQNSFFQAEHNDVLRKQRYEKALQTIEQHISKKEFLDPFNTELCRSFLIKINFPSFDNKQTDYYKIIKTNLTKLGRSQVVNLGGTTYSIEKEVGRGAYGAVFRSNNLSTGSVVAIKYQKPPNTWELYICSEVRKRIKNPDIVSSLLNILFY